MAALRMIIVPIKTFQKQLIPRFFKNNIFQYSLKAVRDKMRRTDRKLMEAAAKVAS